MKWKAKSLICFGLSYVVFLSSAWKKNKCIFPSTRQENKKQTNDLEIHSFYCLFGAWKMILEAVKTQPKQDKSFAFSIFDRLSVV